MTLSQPSILGLLVCNARAAVHGADLVSPVLARWMIRCVLPLVGPGLPSAASALTYHEQLARPGAAGLNGLASLGASACRSVRWLHKGRP